VVEGGHAGGQILHFGDHADDAVVGDDAHAGFDTMNAATVDGEHIAQVPDDLGGDEGELVLGARKVQHAPYAPVLGGQLLVPGLEHLELSTDRAALLVFLAHGVVIPHEIEGVLGAFLDSPVRALSTG